MSKKLYYRDKKSWTLLRNGSIGFAMLGILVLGIVIATPKPTYEMLIRDTIQIQSVEYWHSSHGTGSYMLYSNSGEVYTISGNFNASKLMEEAKTGLRADIKYYKRRLFQDNFIEEMIIGSKTLVTYENNRTSEMIGAIILCSICVLFAVGRLWVGIVVRKSSHYQKT